jgi:NADH dehydrogenase [ubiquinone] 1 alpha subcomplex assembly factor 6
MAGLIRLQWWRDALAAIERGRPPAHPVAEALQAALGAAAVGRARLEAALDARERELEDPPPADLGALERQLEGGSAAITQSALILLGASDPAALEVGRKVGLAIGLAERLRSLDLDRRQGRLLLPTAELARHGIDPEAALAAGRELEPVIRVLAERGLEHLRAARAERRAVPRRGLAALLPGTLAGDHLRRQRQARSSARLPPRGPLAPLRLLWRHALGRF